MLPIAQLCSEIVVSEVLNQRNPYLDFHWQQTKIIERDIVYRGPSQQEYLLELRNRGIYFVLKSDLVQLQHLPYEHVYVLIPNLVVVRKFVVQDKLYDVVLLAQVLFR